MTGWPSFTVICFSFVLSFCAAADGQKPTSRPAVPQAAARARALRLVREVYQKEYASRDVEGRRALARKFIEQAGQNVDDPAARYVLLWEAREIAVGGRGALNVVPGVDPIEYHMDGVTQIQVQPEVGGPPTRGGGGVLKKNTPPHPAPERGGGGGGEK
jgi:hypothetical protein